MNPLHKTLLFLAAACCFTGCETARSHGGRTAILISLSEQRAVLMQGGERVAEASISTGREGHATPVGNFHVIRKDIDHRSGIYGEYVDAAGRVVASERGREKNSEAAKRPLPRRIHALLRGIQPRLRSARGTAARLSRVTRLRPYVVVEGEAVLQCQQDRNTGDDTTLNPMKKNIGMLLLAVYLILVGVIGAFGISLGHLAIVVPILAIAAGVCLLIGK